MDKWVGCAGGRLFVSGKKSCSRKGKRLRTSPCTPRHHQPHVRAGQLTGFQSFLLNYTASATSKAMTCDAEAQLETVSGCFTNQQDRVPGCYITCLPCGTARWIAQAGYAVSSNVWLVLLLTIPGLAVSGGVDSMALAVMCREYLPRDNTELHALIVDHGLRPSSSEEAEKTSETLTSRLGSCLWNC